MNSPSPKQLVLIGGGHAHALVLNQWRQQPLTAVEVTLLSPQAQTPYSGMLPGLVAGHYRYEDAHIDLPALCQLAGVRFIQAAATGLDLDNKRVLIGDNTPVSFDILSINTGITPDLSVPGAAAHTTPVKPINRFFPRWQRVQSAIQQQGGETHLGVVGGGAAGVELILAMDWALRGAPGTLHFHLFQKNQGLPEGYPRAIQRRMAKLFQARNIQIHSGFAVTGVSPLEDLPDGAPTYQLSAKDGRTQVLDQLFWCTQAKASHWFQDTGLATDRTGFIATNEYLQSISHPAVFAAGDTAQQLGHSRARAGVFAVRQGPVLFENLQRVLTDKPLKSHRPQSRFLSLLACGDRYGMGCRLGSWLPSLWGRWVWHWKDRIDRRFMDQFNPEK